MKETLPAADLKKPLSRRKILKRAAFGTLAAGAAWSFGTSHLLDLSRITMTLPGLPPALSPLHVAFAADFHLGPALSEKRMRYVCARLNSLSPDLILLGGDYIAQSADYWPTAVACLSNLSAPLGVFAVPGNHDYWDGVTDFSPRLEAVGITRLVNASVPLGPLDAPLYLVGLDDPWGGPPIPEKAFAAVPSGTPALVLVHSPDVSFEIPPSRASLILAGHTHGWQVYVPFVTRFFIPPDIANFRAGFYATNAGPMYVTRGIGTTTSRLRLFSRPEIVLFQFHSPSPNETGTP